MKIKKRMGALLLVFVLLMGIAPYVSATDENALSAAETLYALGLFKGVGTDSDGSVNFDLERAPTREEAITMLVRLMGLESAMVTEKLLTPAEVWEQRMPFIDVSDWAKPYVAYAYETGLTNGIAPTKFGSKNTVSATQYLTFVLRLLGYSSESDFSWDAAWKLSDQLGITHGQYSSYSNFTRGDVAEISVNALSAHFKTSDETLISSLRDAGMISVEQYTAFVDGRVIPARVGYQRTTIYTSVDELVSAYMLAVKRSDKDSIQSMFYEPVLREDGPFASLFEEQGVSGIDALDQNMAYYGSNTDGYNVVRVGELKPGSDISYATQLWLAVYNIAKRDDFTIYGAEIKADYLEHDTWGAEIGMLLYYDAEIGYCILEVQVQGYWASSASADS